MGLKYPKSDNIWDSKYIFMGKWNLKKIWQCVISFYIDWSWNHIYIFIVSLMSSVVLAPLQNKNELELVKHSSIIAISNTLSLFERKLYNTLLANAYIMLHNEKNWKIVDFSTIFEIKISELKSKIWFDSNNIAYLKTALKNLVRTVVEFNILGKDKQNDWSASSLLASVEIKNNVCSYSFSKVLVSNIINPNIYARLNLSLINSFSSKYALVLYELFCDYKLICQTPNIRLLDFKKFMGVGDKYNEFKILSNRVIKPALKEVNKLTNCEAVAQYEKNGKSVKALKFYFKNFDVERKKSNSIIANNFEIQNPLQQELYRKLIEVYKLSHFQAKEVIQDYPIAYINETLEIAKVKRNQKLVKNIGAYTITLIKNGYTKQIKTKPWQVRLENNKSDSYDVVSSDANRHLIHSSKTKASKSINEILQNFSEEKKIKLIKEFEEEKINKNDFLKTAYKKHWLESVLFRVMFGTWMK